MIDKEYDKLIRPIKICCLMFGGWPKVYDFNNSHNNNKMSINKIKSKLLFFYRYLVIGLLLFLASATTAEAVIYSGLDMNETIECSLISSSFYLAVFRITIFMKYQRDIFYVIEIMKQDWANVKERDLLRIKSYFSFKLAKIFIISVLLAGLSFILMPIVEVFNHLHLEICVDFIF